MNKEEAASKIREITQRIEEYPLARKIAQANLEEINQLISNYARSMGIGLTDATIKMTHIMKEFHDANNNMSIGLTDATIKKAHIMKEFHDANNKKQD